MKRSRNPFETLLIPAVVAGAVLLLAGADVARAADPFSETETIEASAISGAIPLSPGAAAWKSPKAATIRVYPQMTVRLNDVDANASTRDGLPREVQVKALVSSTEVGVEMEWKDSTRSLVSASETASFGDSAAVQFPVKFGRGLRLPHIGMGDEGAPVRVYLQRATDAGMRLAEFVGKGFGSLTRTVKPHARMQMDYDEKAGVWRAVMVRPLVAAKHSLSGGLVPIAFAFWDGEGRQRGGNKFLSRWKFLRMSRFPVDSAYLKQVSWGFGEGQSGSVQAGHDKVGQLCIGCHRVGEYKSAPEGMAPALDNVGGIATPSYLRDSIMSPSEVVVRNLQINRHYNKAAEPDDKRAYPNNELYLWYIDLGNGKKMSRMPALNLPEGDVADIVAYLRTQDGTTQSQGR